MVATAHSGGWLVAGSFREAGEVGGLFRCCRVQGVGGEPGAGSAAHRFEVEGFREGTEHGTGFAWCLVGQVVPHP